MATRTSSTTIEGSAAAAILASGIGCFVLGLVTTLAQASLPLRTALTFIGPVGPLSGKTIVTVIVWLIAWAILYFLWRGRAMEFRPIYLATLILIALGLLGTFPVFFELFGT